MSNVKEIVGSCLCYGCGTCNVICGHLAITMQYDNIGRLYPIIDEAKCTNCGLCYIHCPSLDLKEIQLPNTDDKYIGHVDNVYIGKATDKRIYKNSQSGGLVTATVKYLLESGKIDAAIMCRVEDAVEYAPKAVVVKSPEELYSCQKSSYVPIDIVSALKDAQKYSSIAVVGTGCHIQGIRALRNFNKKYRKKIKYTLGLICDRTLCKTVTDVLYGDYFKGVPKKMIWRDKSIDYKHARLLIQNANKEVFEIPQWKRFALKDPFTNPRCRICFDKLNTGADIVFGDPWGMNNVDWKGGMSVVLIRSKEGTDIISDMIAHCLIEMREAPLKEVITGQHIEKRKRDVSTVLAYYQRKKWLVPSYAAILCPSAVNSQLVSFINKFVEDCSKSKEEIIKQNTMYLRNTAIKSNVSRILSLPKRIIKKLISII